MYDRIINITDNEKTRTGRNYRNPGFCNDRFVAVAIQEFDFDRLKWWRE